MRTTESSARATTAGIVEVEIAKIEPKRIVTVEPFEPLVVSR